MTKSGWSSPEGGRPRKKKARIPRAQTVPRGIRRSAQKGQSDLHSMEMGSLVTEDPFLSLRMIPFYGMSAFALGERKAWRIGMMEVLVPCGGRGGARLNVDGLRRETGAHQTLNSHRTLFPVGLARF